MDYYCCQPHHLSSLQRPVLLKRLSGTDKSKKVQSNSTKNLNLTITDSPSQQQWESLEARMNPDLRLFNEGWFSSWSNHLSNKGIWSGPVRYCVITGAEGDIQGIFPTAYQRVGLLSFLSLAGPYLPFRCIPFTSETEYRYDAFQLISDYLTDAIPASSLRLGPLTSQDAEFMVPALRERGWRIHTKDSQTELSQRLPNSYDEFISTFSKRRIKKMRGNRNRIERSGRTEVKKYCELDHNRWSDLMPELEHIESHSFVGLEGLDDRFIQPEKQAFWVDFLGSCNEHCQPTVWILYLDDEPIGYDFVIDCGETRYGYANAYHQDYARFSPGTILLETEMRESFERGIRYVNWGPGDSDYKRTWGANIERELIDLLAFRGDAKGALMSGVFLLHKRAKKMSSKPNWTKLGASG